MSTKIYMLSKQHIYQFILGIALLFVALQPAHAVLKERNIDESLAILRQELTNYRWDLDKQSGNLRAQQAAVIKELVIVGGQSQQNAIMLYSQHKGNVFDMTYACHAATEQYKQFRNNAAPFRQYIDNNKAETDRLDSLISDLSTMYTGALSPKAQTDRNVCLTLAINIRHTLGDNNKQMQQYIRLYDMTESNLKRLNDYATKCYTSIQQSIFSNAGDNYYTILRNFGREYHLTKQSVIEKYSPMHKVRSEWDGRVILLFFVMLAIGVALAAFVNYLVVGFAFTQLVRRGKIDFVFDRLMKRKEGRSPKEAFVAKRRVIIATTTVITFAIMLGVLRQLISQNFFTMASGLLVEFAWLMAVILLSLLVRLDAEQMRNGLRIYAPVLTGCFLVIVFRILLIPSTLVSLAFPPMLLACALWQWRVVSVYQKTLPRSDVFYTSMSLAVFLVSVVSSLVGYTLLSVEILIWWTMQLTCILTITCAKWLLESFGNNPKRRLLDRDTPLGRAWAFRFLYYAVLPVAGTFSIILSIYWAADVFNLSDTTMHLFSMKLINTKNFTFSVLRAVMVVVLFYVFAYINHTSLGLLHLHFLHSEQYRAKEEKRKEDIQSVVSRTAMWRNVIQVLVWGVWLMISMKIFNIDNSWIVAISAGLSTGIGFAMKDILENIYYGISLMAGRIRVGDYVSIDGMRGTVRSISYTSTMIEALDGSIVSFQNSQLFSKNYKNLTKNHGNELVSVSVGVAYGSNAAQVRQIIGDAVKAIERKNYIKYINTVFVNFGDNSIDFKVLAWVDSRKSFYATGDINEAVYDALNKNNIEIPYPQRDVHLRKD